MKSIAFKLWVKGLEDLKIRGQGETIYTSALLRSVKILKSCNLNSIEKPSVNSGVKNYLEIFEDIGNRHHQPSGDERKKIRKGISEEPESYSRQNYIAETLSKE